MLARLLLSIAILAPFPAAAQIGGTAHLYAYRIADVPAFEAGYRKHLEWHAARGDRLVWYGWYVAAGDRAGAFVDGTFGTTPEALAGRPDPDGDGADFRANAAPFATAIGDEGWELWREASTATPLEERRPQAIVQVHRLVARDPQAFETALRAQPLAGASWYRAIEGEPGTYLVIAPAGSADAPPRPEALFGRTHPALALVRATRSETWRYAPRLALLPGTPLAR
ncbi:MAG: hypothetical protein J7500_09330 [Sphingomonas sp.]|uniref:hypothetical protein n=1 Tax=Sphingomonas sp. TaxID=28214 RepID=UPI001B2C4D8B|nr:hypothetical protein [Sphingomonas sp.]MBO9622899.1 hypothetical protein [Sphingomonas sp.]